MAQNHIPGTVIPYSEISESMFDYFRPIISAAGGLSLGQICAMTGLEISTIQNWVKRGFVPHPENKKYFERQIARILLISALRDSMKIDQIGELLTIINGDTDDINDDIVSETDLYDYFCEACRAFESSEDNGNDVISAVTKDFKCSDEEIHLRLNEALSVMVCAHTAGILKRRADDSLERLKSKIK